MSAAPRYLDGFLAAVRPGDGCGNGGPPPLEARQSPAGPVGAASPSVEERIKRGQHPLDSFARLLDGAEANRPPDADERFRFQWFGLFYQAPGQDAFLLRLRLPGGRLETFQLAALAEIIQELAGGQIVLNPRGGLDVPGVPVRAAAEILRRTENIGLSARRTGGDCVRCIRGGEDEGLMADDSRAPVLPLVRALEQALSYHHALADLPRGCEIAFQREDEPPDTDEPGETDTLTLQVRRETVSPRDNGYGGDDAPSFLLAIAGYREAGFLLPASRTVPACLKLLEAWAAGADRTNRQSASLAAFCATLGAGQVSAILEGASWQPWGTHSRVGSDPAAKESSPGFVIPGGRLLSHQLRRLESIIREYAPGEIRLFRGCLYAARPVPDAAREAIQQALASG